MNQHDTPADDATAAKRILVEMIGELKNRQESGADVWAFGFTEMRLLRGVVLFSGDDEPQASIEHAETHPLTPQQRRAVRKLSTGPGDLWIRISRA